MRREMATPHLSPSHISVSFMIVTPDQLRKIIFKLTKSNVAPSAESWSVQFELHQRPSTTGTFAPVITLEVDVDLVDSTKAASTMKHGLDSDQHAQALQAGDTARDVTTGAALPADAKADAKAVVSARNPASPV